MLQAVVSARRSESQSTIFGQHLAGLARTYEQAASPVWVYDLSERCVYRNRSAESYRRNGTPISSFEITDHAGRVIGRLDTVSP